MAAWGIASGIQVDMWASAESAFQRYRNWTALSALGSLASNCPARCPRIEM